MNNKMNKSTKYLIISILVLFLSILGASMAYYLARVQGTLNGRAAGTELTIEVTKLSTNADDDLIPLDNDLETLNLAAKGYQDKGSCVDINGYSVCQIYKVTLTNNGTVPLTMNGTVTLSGDNVPNINCATMTNETTVANNNSCMGQNVFVSGDTLAANDSNDYYVMVYINNLDEPQYDSGEFNGTVTFTTEDGKRVKGRFRSGELLVEHIIDLYEGTNKTIVSANSSADGQNRTIDYNYAVPVNLMNDRLGGTTEDLDGGNIRYYGANPNNYIDIGDRTQTGEVILWRIIGVFDGKIRIVREQSIGGYSWNTSVSTINNGNGINQWGPSGDYTGASIMKLLNPGYDNNQDYDYEGNLITVNNSLWWNSESGICYSYDRDNNRWTTSECDFTNSGLSSKAKNYIIDQVINLRGVTKSSVYADQMYVNEKQGTVFDSTSQCYGESRCNDTVTRTTSWTGKVGLVYLSDYGYAADLNVCKSRILFYSKSECKDNNWLFNSSSFWTNTPDPSSANATWCVTYGGNANYAGCNGIFGNQIFPVVTLSPDIIIGNSGDGSKQKPYVLTS